MSAILFVYILQWPFWNTECSLNHLSLDDVTTFTSWNQNGFRPPSWIQKRKPSNSFSRSTLITKHPMHIINNHNPSTKDQFQPPTMSPTRNLNPTEPHFWSPFLPHSNQISPWIHHFQQGSSFSQRQMKNLPYCKDPLRNE